MSAAKSGPTAPKCSDEEFVELFDRLGAKITAERIGSTERNVYARRRRLEEKNDRPIIAPSLAYLEAKYPHRLQQEIKNGTILVGSDFHIWPGQESTALKAFKKFADDIRPTVVILNGDVLDFPSIGRHAPIMWESAPEPWQEIEAAQDHLHDIATASKRARKIWTLGNHDARFEANLASNARQYRNIKGVHLSDHFPLWEKGWSCAVNSLIEPGRTMIKHKPRGGGMNAARASTLNSGWSFVHGHLHSQKVSPITDYNGDRYGVDAGMVADSSFKQFVNYTEDTALDWRSGFCVLTYRDGRLMAPELVTVWDDKRVQFRGGLIKA
jgi:hypothetical protein